MDLFKILLFLHIAGGGISLIAGLIIMIQKKGGKLHRVIGRVYYYSLLTSSLVALPMSYLHPNFFLFIVGVFTSYMLLTGVAYLNKKSLADVRTYDGALTAIMTLFGLGFVVIGGINLYKGVSFGIVLVVFGMISLALVRTDWRNFRGYSTVRNYWLTTHLQRMVGSYIAAVTAFLVVNNKFLPGTIVWLLPTFILTPLIFRWTKKYSVKLNRETVIAS